MHTFPPLNEQMDLIRLGAVEVIPEEELARKIEWSIAHGTPLNVKLGADPSRPDLHIGHAVVLTKLRHFQDLGHMATLIIGDFTGMIGDPSGRNKTRPSLTIDETRRNGQSYFEQATQVLSTKRIKMVYNSDWLSRMTFADVVRLASKYTVARMLERDDFEKRYHANLPISVHEFLYPLAQAMDSVVVKSDVELGGTDQKFNLLVAREIQREYGIEAQAVVTMPLLEGTDGKEKMSKSYDNYIALSDAPNDMFGKTMSIPDDLIVRYFQYAVFAVPDELEAVKRRLEGGENPRDVKAELGRRIVARYHGEEAATRAEEAFTEVFRKKELPDDIADWAYAGPREKDVLSLLVDAGLVTSKGEGRRMIQQGGVSIDGERVTDERAVATFDAPRIVRVGKRKFLRIVPQS